jgi:EAL domain-containing protein (putative c-di-GMP-specific phosphodiesterase class I)/DNA-binding NarL/FixJ family response regulator
MLDFSFTKQLSALFVEDEAEAREIGKKLFSRFFRKVDTAEDGEKGLKKFKENNYDVVITDITMPKLNGIELIKRIREIKPNQEIIILTAHSDRDLILETINLNVGGYVLKPINLDIFMQVLEKVVNNIKIIKMHETNEKELRENIRKKVEKIEKLLYYDTTTSLPNIYKLKNELFKDDIAFVVDISNFKKINAVFGIEVGDKVLKDLGEFLKYKYERVYKLPEAVFCILSKDLDLDSLCKDINNYSYKDEKIKINFTFKIYGFYADEFLKKFNLLNSYLKDQKIKRLCKFFSKEDLKEIMSEQKEHQKWINRVIEAINNDYFEPFFQPIIDNITLKAVKYESLIRMKLGNNYVSPYLFLKPAKNSGLMHELTKLMVKKSFAVVKKKNINISLNITREDLLEDDFIEFICKEKENIIGDITLEILENIENFNDNLIEKIKHLKKRGFFIAIDDFGRGYSNFHRVIEVNPDFIKIDGSLIKNIENPKFFHTVFSVLNFAKSLNSKIVAEYVENEKIFNIVKMIGIEYSQGYYFSPPIRKDDIKG